MTDDEYRDAMDLLVNQIRVLQMLPLDDLLDVVERAESVGFLFVAPLEYSAGIDNLRDQRKLLQAAKVLVAVAKEIGEGGSVTDDPLDRMAADGFLAERTTFYAVLYPRLREVARQHGYALALHGSLAKDLDVIAVPWTVDAGAPEALVAGLVEAAGGLIPPDRRLASNKPHGRKAVTIMLGGAGGYIDLAVMPRAVRERA